MACCKEIGLKSSKYSQEQLKSLGKYILKPTDVVENHAVYKHELSDEHIAFSADYGWTVYPNTPDDKDPPLVSFNDCKPPAFSDCPTKCINAGQWTYFYQNTVTDENKTLSLNCFQETDGGEGVLGTGGVICIIITLLLAIVILILFIHHFKPELLPEWLRKPLSRLMSKNSRTSGDPESLHDLDIQQSNSLIKNGDNHTMQLKTGDTPKKEPIKVVVTPKKLQLPIESCVLQVSCDPLPKAENSYTYKLTLTHKKHKDSDSEVYSFDYHDNIIHLSKFESLPHELYNYKLKVTSSDEKSEGEDNGELNIYPDSSMVDGQNVIYDKCKNIKVGDRIWSNSTTSFGDNITISKLPSFLKETTLFKLPMKHIETGTIFNITALPSSRIYIVQEKDGGWTEQSLLDLSPSWTEETCDKDPFEVKRSAKGTPGVVPKQFSILWLETSSTQSFTVLPEILPGHGHKHIAIFLREELIPGFYKEDGCIKVTREPIDKASIDVV